MKTTTKVHIIITRKKGKLQEFLVLKRVKGRNHWQGVTGTVEPHDKNLAYAAARELYEELHVTVDHDDLLGPMYDFMYETQIGDVKDAKVKEYCFIYLMPSGVRTKLSEEHTESKWLPLNEAVKIVKFDEPKNALKKAAVEVAALPAKK